jgi:hypothetical protein
MITRRASPFLFMLLLHTSRVAAQDTLIVRADNPPVWGAAPELVEELRIGVLEGNPAYTFGRITGVIAHESGEIWVADSGAHLIRRFSPDGRHLGDVGREGQGPGEFGSPWIAMDRLPDGRVAAWDMCRPLIHLFGSDGTFLTDWTVRRPSCGGQAQPMRADPTGILHLRSSILTGPPIVIGSGRPVSGLLDVWFAADSTGVLFDTLQVPPPDNVAQGGRNGPFGRMRPYTPRTTSAFSSLGYLITGRTDRYALFRTLRDGRVVRIERRWTPVPARAEERAQFRAQLDAQGERTVVMGRLSGMPPDYAVTVPDTKPPFWAFQVDHDGRIWVAVHQAGYYRAETSEERRQRLALRLKPPNPALEWWEPLVTDVIEPTGRFLGTIRFPNPQTSIFFSRGDRIWVVELGEFDEQYVVRYRITPGS